MFDFIRTHTRILFFVLILLIIPSFVLFGIDGYQRFGDGSAQPVAKVDGRPILQAELDAAHREQVERVRRQMPNLDAALFDSPEMKRQTLDAVVRERVIGSAAQSLHLVTTDQRLQRLFATDPQFAFLRNPDGSVNNEVLAAQGMNSQIFAQRLRQDLSTRQVLAGVSGTVVATDAVTAAALDALFQQRELQLQRFDPKEYATKVSPTDADLEKYHADPLHAARFQAAEQATIEYVVLDIESLKAGIALPEEDLRKYYAENQARYTAPEERRASHILIKAEKGASSADREKAKAKAEGLLAEVQKNPGAFADLARKNSDDPGSAANGGDLDFFGRGAMVRPFEEAAYGLKAGETSGLVETDFGFHIIRLVAVRGGDKRAFDAVRPEIENEVRRQLAQKKFAELATDFGNLVYEQPDSLKPAAERFKLEVRTAQAVTRTPAPGATGPLASAKFLEALFGNEALRNKRNTEAVETGSNQLVSGRVVQYSPARQLPLAEVRAQVREAVVAEQSAALARKEGLARLAALRAAPDGALDAAAIKVSRAQPGDVPRDVIDAVLKADAAKLPAVLGVDLGAQGYTVVRLTKVLGRDPAAGDAARGRDLYTRAWGDAETQAYYEALKLRFKVEIKPSAVAAAAAASAALR
jgi:peptidyl-prolyl cis-trans isomerase D